ncbi:PREDICTED: rhodopsin, GQ-coupled-like [Amphimedon queenslandica]|uniref:G-protein coupled receptors family 1 profile domain-containing protein n=1 Tax=Amphimedon queenslandica TaxID=400682 RepID=A0AAN0J7N8_AMPQE|nr:PREDICTED: rhodopsin, GQ-coupled-like [Amphimedon queenslandica]XP_019852713.1 PREDICTED: rhodopsin, GQ-coupled-like [Amphimedon queenslandica]|eukprot:XP_019852712.1 PREDICTED: rhodopsin, GQ-coupled-like [Amphimedon queenslandica]
MSFNSTDFVLTGDINSPTYAAALGIEGVIGIIANVAVLLMTLYQRKSWNQSSTIFFTSLLLSNLIIALWFLMSSIAVGAEEWIFGNTFEEKNATCLVVAYLIWNCSIITMMTLAAISFDRFLFIVKPHLHKRFMRPRVALILIIGVWLLCSLINTTPFYGFGVYGYYSPGGFCSPCYETSSSFYLLFLVVVYSIIYFIIIFTSVWTFCFTRRFMQDQAEIVGNNVYQSRRKRLFGIFGYMLISYLIALLPSYIDGAISMFYYLPACVRLGFVVTYGSFIISNPIIQSYFRPEIVIIIKNLWNKVRNTSRSPDRNLNYIAN